MSEYKIPDWLLAPECVKGEPLSRIKDWDPNPFIRLEGTEDYLEEAIRAFDALRAENLKIREDRIAMQLAFEELKYNSRIWRNFYNQEKPK